MGLIYIVFTWLVLMIMLWGWRWLKEKKRIKKFKARIKSYEPMSMSISERLKYKGRHRR